MKIRVVQIWGFLMTVLGWIFIACTMAMEGWKISSIGGMGGSSIIKVAWYWSSLWRSCFTDSTAVSNCYDFPVLWSVQGSIQIVRGLLMSALSLGMLGFVLSLLGMECTFIGGKDRSKHKKVYAGGCCHIASGNVSFNRTVSISSHHWLYGLMFMSCVNLCVYGCFSLCCFSSGLLAASGYAVYAHHVSTEYFNPSFDGLKFDLGTPLFLGWVGSAFHMTGGFFYLWSVCTPLCGRKEMIIKIQKLPDPEKNKSTTALTTASKITSKTKVSSISELSSNLDISDVSDISSRSERTSASGRSARSGRSSKTGRTSDRSTSGSESSTSTLSTSQSSSRTVSSLSGSSKTESMPFIINSYI
ncbi:hypothetical protein fugu_002362 [Takifugu bimaculatus]|uniref:Claudin n=1 Tax=Takifugu bimaculatus TaxID=433685 RepID=A0A4Z2BRH2_9TELE|nr:hypothetical protein fugu_002362 [Takifugu bimaculatus]